MEPIPDEVIRKLQEIRYLGGKADTEDILTLLKIRLHQLKRAFICIDAIDELEPKVRLQLFNILKELGTNNTHLFLTGRNHIENEIQNHLQAIQRNKIVISANPHDIRTFLEQQIKDDSNPDAMDEVLVGEIIDTIIKKSHGM